LEDESILRSDSTCVLRDVENMSLYKHTLSSTPVPIILGGNMSVQMKPRFIKKRSLMMANFTVMNSLQKPVAEIKET
jgi:hypothetical protein